MTYKTALRILNIRRKATAGESLTLALGWSRGYIQALHDTKTLRLSECRHLNSHLDYLYDPGNLDQEYAAIQSIYASDDSQTDVMKGD